MGYSEFKFLKQFDCEFNKVASAMIVSEEFLKEVAMEKKHTLYLQVCHLQRYS